MLDYVVRGATVIDGTGAPGRTADVGMRDGRIAEVGRIEGRSAASLDADGLVLAPGFIDPHTHYDAQLMWDGTASPSNLHGVTTLVSGNCGFTLAPVKPADMPFMLRVLSVVEGMSLTALELGVTFEGGTFGEYLDALEGGLAVNVGFMAGHSALRHFVMGDEAVDSAASDDQVQQMAELLEQCLEAGALGLSTSRHSAHRDHLGRAVASIAATELELLHLCEVTAHHPGTTLELTLEGAIGSFTSDEEDLLVAMSLAANGASLNWNQLLVSAADAERVRRQMEVSAKARRLGAHVTALTLPVPVANFQSFLHAYGLHRVPGIGALFDEPPAERIRMLQDVELRTKMAREAEAAGTRHAFAGPLTLWEQYRVMTFSPEVIALSGRSVKDIALERGKDAFTTLAEILIADDLQTILWPDYPESDADLELKFDLWRSGDVLFGGSDAGAHSDRLCGTTYPSDLLAGACQGTLPITLEEAVHALTDQPSRFFKLRDRGQIRQGAFADVVVFDPDTIGATTPELRFDLPGGDCHRVVAGATGIKRVFVNGVETLADGVPTTATPGRVIRSGK